MEFEKEKDSSQGPLAGEEAKVGSAVSAQSTPLSSWARGLSEKQGAAIWVGTCLIGGIAISLIADVRGVLVAVALLFVYAGTGWVRQIKDITKFADSVYFLGFLWTMMALIHALYSNIAADQVFYAFGYALTATATGMFLRMAILQSYVTAPDHLRDAQVEMDQRLYEFRDQLAKVNQDVEEFRTSTLKEKLKQLDEELHQSFEFYKNLNKQHEEIQKTNASSSQALVEIVKDFDSMKNVFQNLHESIDELNAKAKGFSTTEIPKMLGDFQTTQRSIAEAHDASQQLYRAVSEALDFSRTHLENLPRGRGGF